MCSGNALHRVFFRAWVACRRKGEYGHHRGLVAKQGQTLAHLTRDLAHQCPLASRFVGAEGEADNEPLGGGGIATIGRVLSMGLCKCWQLRRNQNEVILQSQPTKHLWLSIIRRIARRASGESHCDSLT